MKQVNQKYKVRITVVSPLSIGQGGEKDWVQGIDFIWDKDDQIMYHLDLQLIADAGIPLDTISALFSSGDVGGIHNLIKGKLEDVCDFSMEMPVNSLNPIKSFYFNPLTGKYVLFGSSLKGAIRSSLFRALTYDVKRQDLINKKKGLDDFVFGRMKDGTSFMRFIRVGDFDFDETKLVNTKIYNLHKDKDEWIGGWKHQFNKTDVHFNSTGFNTIYECLMPGEQSSGHIMVSPLLFNMVNSPMEYKNKKDGLLSGDSIRKLFRAINEATQDYIKKEIHFFEEYCQGEYSGRIIASLNKYQGLALSFIESGNSSCLIKMSAGSGFHSITGNWLYDDYTDTGFNPKNGKKNYKSRKIACYGKTFTPMGFAKLEVID